MAGTHCICLNKIKTNCATSAVTLLDRRTAAKLGHLCVTGHLWSGEERREFPRSHPRQATSDTRRAFWLSYTFEVRERPVADTCVLPGVAGHSHGASKGWDARLARGWWEDGEGVYGGSCR